MRLIHVIPYVGWEASGPTYTTLRLTRALAQNGHDVRLLSVLDGQVDSAGKFQHNVYPRSRLLAAMWRSPELWRALRSSAPGADVLHSHGMWTLPNVYAGWARRVSSAPLVISPHGTLSAWALGHSRWKKRAVWTLLQGRVVRSAACLHATAENEYREFRDLGLRQPVCVIPNGVDVPEAVAATPIRTPNRSERTLLYMGRLHAKKGVDRLLRAWAVIENERPGWGLRVVGPDDGGHGAELRALARALGLARATFVGPVFGEDKWREYGAADAYVLPTHSENFGLTVAEALAAGTPVITTRGAPWSGLARERCGLWIEQGLEPLVVALREITALEPADLAAWGARGRAWMLEDYRWDTIVEQMTDVYRWLCAGGPTPKSVRLD
jgi:glycosyltransferase involved in cell wall biosynthesis